MRIVTVRRISQAFFATLLVWFCIVNSFGTEWWQLRGWPVNWFLELDPLVALGTVLGTRTLYGGLLWSLATVSLTLLLGRFFCGWVCPFGTIHQFVGYLGKRGKSAPRRLSLHQYHHLQSLKYYLLFFLLSAAGGALLADLARFALDARGFLWALITGSVLLAAYAALKTRTSPRRASALLFGLLSGWLAMASLVSVGPMISASLQTGLLDPIPLVYRSISLVFLPLSDAAHRNLAEGQRHYEGAWFIGAVFLAAVLLNLYRPRFYCRYLCPLGALFGIISRTALWRVIKAGEDCPRCGLCAADCEGACEPQGALRFSECVLCMNCLHACRDDLLGYGLRVVGDGAVASPDLSRRSALITVATGMAVVPMLGLDDLRGANYSAAVIRPPGALPEAEFLSRCIKCGQCMRICPTNIIQPAGLEAGPEGIWTPILNFRIGTSGCQLNCVACSHICPTAAIRPMGLDEKVGRHDFEAAGPVRIGTAFVDHGRCLPWAMDRPCIVCQENCPVSPKAIFVREVFQKIRGGTVVVSRADSLRVVFGESAFETDRLATGDYFVLEGEAGKGRLRRIAANTADTIELFREDAWEPPPSPGTRLEIQVRLQRPQVDVKRCIGCGVCEHECPVTGVRAIRVSAENESRHRNRKLTL